MLMLYSFPKNLWKEMVGLADRDVGQNGHHVSDIQIKDVSLELRVISH